jgi:hypothetical protein
MASQALQLFPITDIIAKNKIINSKVHFLNEIIGQKISNKFGLGHILADLLILYAHFLYSIFNLN